MNKFSKLTLISTSFLFLLSSNLISQEVEEVVVTAQRKRNQFKTLHYQLKLLLQKVLTENMIEDISDLAEVVPGLIMDKGIGSGASYSIRGTGSYGVGAAVIGAVVTASMDIIIIHHL